MTSDSPYPNNDRLRALFEASGLTLSIAMTLFNRGFRPAVTESIFKGWLAEPGDERWCEVSAAPLQQAEQAWVK